MGGVFWFIRPDGAIIHSKPGEHMHEDMTERVFGKFIDSCDFYKLVYPKGWLRCNFWRGNMGVQKGNNKINNQQYLALEMMWKKYKAKKMFVDIDTTGGRPDSFGPMDLQQFREKFV